MSALRAVRLPMPEQGWPRMRCPAHPEQGFPAHGWVGRPVRGQERLYWCGPLSPRWDRSTGRVR